MAAVLQGPDLIAGLQHVVDALREFRDGLRKAVAEHDHSLWHVRAVVLEIDRLSLHPLVTARFHPGGEIRLDRIAHLFGIVLFADPAHGDPSLSVLSPL